MHLTVNFQSPVNVLLAKSYVMLEKGCFEDSQSLLRRAHALDFENSEICSALKACGYWVQRKHFMTSAQLNISKGDYLRKQWYDFSKFHVQHLEDPFVEGKRSINKWVHRTALGYFMETFAETGGIEPVLSIARCHKALGNYNEAINVFKRSLLSQRFINDSRIFAEMADIYALLGEMFKAKVMMREALFINPESIDLQEIVSPLFIKLIKRMEMEGISPDESSFLDWMGVYGNLWGVLDVKRELNHYEIGNLRQRIHTLSNRLLNGEADNNRALTARLINHYLWLIDYNQNIDNNKSETDEALMNIRMLSHNVYNLYLS